MTRKSIGCAIWATLSLLVAFVAFRLSPVYQHLCVTEHTTFSVPNSDVAIQHSRIGTHLLAEYDRWLTVIVDGKPLETRELACDTCGGYPINCYVLKENGALFLRLYDDVSEHLVDLQTGEVHEVHQINGTKYYGVVRNGNVTTVWSAGSVNGVPNPITIRDLPAKLLSDIISDDTGGYIGQIDGKLGRLTFYSNKERKEAEIDHRF